MVYVSWNTQDVARKAGTVNDFSLIVFLSYSFLTSQFPYCRVSITTEPVYLDDISQAVSNPEVPSLLQLGKLMQAGAWKGEWGGVRGETGRIIRVHRFMLLGFKPCNSLAMQ